MSDRYQGFVSTPIGKLLVKNLGLPNPTPLERYDRRRAAGRRHRRGRRRRPAGRVLPAALDGLGIASATTLDGGRRAYKALVFDATGITDTAGLVALRDFFTPLHAQPRDLPARGRASARRPSSVSGVRAGRPARPRGLHPLASARRSAAAAPSSSCTSPTGAEGGDRLDAGVPALPQVGVRLRPGRPHRRPRRRRPPARSADWTRPLAGKVALVTGASRGIGEQIARVLHRDGATVVGVDVPQAASELQTLMGELDGDHLVLDITAKDAPQRIAHHLSEQHGGVDVVVHNAGITRDKKLANMAARTAGTRVIARQPDRPGADHPRAARPGRRSTTNGRIVGVASIAGIAGNVGQTNYADLQGRRHRPGRLASPTSWPTASRSTPSRPASSSPQMTAAVPFATREVGQRLNAMARAACRSTSPRRSRGSPAPARPRSTATSSASAAR